MSSSKVTWVYVVGVRQGYDTRELQLKGTSTFGGGEIATAGIPLEHHFGWVQYRRLHNGPTREEGLTYTEVARGILVDKKTNEKLYNQVEKIMQGMKSSGTRRNYRIEQAPSVELPSVKKPSPEPKPHVAVGTKPVVRALLSIPTKPEAARSPQPTPSKTTVPTQQPELKIDPRVEAIDQRWGRLALAVPTNKADEWKFGASCTVWLERRFEAENAPVLDWATQYLDWLQKEWLSEADKLSRRWREIREIVRDLILTETFHKRGIEMDRKFERWTALHVKAKTGAETPKSEEFLEEPGKFLDEIVAKYKGNTAARWSQSTLFWKNRESFYWK